MAGNKYVLCFAATTIIVLFTIVYPSHASGIVWVSDGHRTVDASVADDQAWVDILRSLGYQVERFNGMMQDNEGGPDLDLLNTADLVIVSRDTDSASAVSSNTVS